MEPKVDELFAAITALDVARVGQLLEENRLLATMENADVRFSLSSRFHSFPFPCSHLQWIENNSNFPCGACWEPGHLQAARGKGRRAVCSRVGNTSTTCTSTDRTSELLECSGSCRNARK